MNKDVVMKKTFIEVLYIEMNDVNRSRYLVANTMANKIWLLPEIPEKIKIKQWTCEATEVCYNEL